MYDQTNERLAICPVCGHQLLSISEKVYLNVEQTMKRTGLGKTLVYEFARYFARTGGPHGIPCVRVASNIRVPEGALHHALAHGLVRIPAEANLLVESRGEGGPLAEDSSRRFLMDESEEEEPWLDQAWLSQPWGQEPFGPTL